MDESDLTVTDGTDLAGLPVLFPSEDTVRHPIDVTIVAEAAARHDVPEPHVHGVLNAITDAIDERRRDNDTVFEMVLKLAVDDPEDVEVKGFDSIVVVEDHCSVAAFSSEVGVETDADLMDAAEESHKLQAQEQTGNQYTESEVLVLKNQGLLLLSFSR